MQVREYKDVEQALIERYNMDRGGGFFCPDFDGHYKFNIEGDDRSYCICYFEDGTKVFVKIKCCPASNTFLFYDWTKPRYKKLYEDYEAWKTKVFAQLILWCIDDD